MKSALLLTQRILLTFALAAACTACDSSTSFSNAISPTTSPTTLPSSSPTPGHSPTPAPSASPSPTQTPSVRQTANAVVNGTTFQTSLGATFTEANLEGSAIWVVVSAPSKDASGGHPWKFGVTDTQGNTYTQLGINEDDGSPGNQSVAQFLATNARGGSNNKVSFTMTYNGGAGSDNYLGIFVAEVTGGATHSFSGQLNDNPNVTGANGGTNLISSGALSATAGPVFVLALSMNTDGGGSDEGGSGDPGPTAGTGLTQQGTMFWKMDGTTPLATFATGSLTPSAGAVDAYFNAQAATSTGTNDYATVAIGFYP